MRERVQRRADGLRDRQAERQLRLVDDRVQVRAGTAAAHPAVGIADAEERRPLGARVRRRHRDERQPARRRRGLARVDRAAAADRDDRVDAVGNLDPVRRHLLPAIRGVEDVAPARARDDERPRSRQRRQLLDPPADDHSESFARANSTNASAARVGVRPEARTSEISRLRVEPLDLRRGQRARRELRLDGRARDERDAVAGLHRAPHRLLQPELEPDVEVAQPRPDRAQLVLDDLADAGSLLHHDQALAAQLLERHRAAGEAVAGRAREDHLVVEERLERDRTMAPRRADDPELELARGDALDDRLRVGDRQRDPDAGVLALELAEEERHDDRGRPGRGAELQLAGQLALALAGDLVEDLALERQQALRAAVEPQALPRSARRGGRSGRAAASRAASRAPAPAARRRAG